MNRGASETRSEVKRAVIDMHAVNIDGVAHVPKYKVIDFIDGMAARDNAKAGGKGRTYPIKPKGRTKRAPKGQGQG